MKRTTAFLGMVLASAAASLQLPAAESLGTAFTYQGELSEGADAATGIFDLRFTLHDSSAGGGTLGSPITVDNMGITNGVFTVPLDFGAGLFNGQARWIEISVRHGTNIGAFTVLAPRQAITAAPYALHAANVAWESINGIPQGVTNAAAGGHFGEIWSGANNSSGLDVRNSTGGTALTGKQGAGSGLNGAVTAGVFGDSASGDGVVGASQFRGVWGYAAGNSENFGVYGYTASPLGTGVQGRAGSAGGGTGVRGEAVSPTGLGVIGEAYSLTGVNAGVMGRSSSTQGVGVFGISTNSTGANKGMHAVTQSAQGVGILAENTKGGVAVRANGRVQSTADSVLFIPAWAIRAEQESILVWTAEKPTDNLQFPEIQIPSSNEPWYAHVPMTLPGKWYGEPVTVKEITIFYEVTGADARIDLTQLRANGEIVHTDHTDLVGAGSHTFTIPNGGWKPVQDAGYFLDFWMSLRNNVNSGYAKLRFRGAKVRISHY